MVKVYINKFENWNEFFLIIGFYFSLEYFVIYECFYVRGVIIDVCFFFFKNVNKGRL